MRLRMDGLGPEHVGRTITWVVPAGDESAQRYVPTTRTLRGAKRVSDSAPTTQGRAYPNGIVALTCDPQGHAQGPFYVGAHWPVTVEDAA